MPRNLIVCCDGTNNEFGKVNTNVVRVVQSIVHDTDGQLIYYDPGIGTLAQPGAITRIGKLISKGIDLAFATGLTGKVADAYIYLMNTWQPGDRIFLFGFSRGSYTARVLAGVLHHIGLLPRGLENLVPYAVRLLQVASSHQPEKLAIGDAFRRTFARPIPGSDERRCPVHFVGLWDTVSSVGWIWDPARYAFTEQNPSIGTIRHAIAIDERRAMYRQNRFRAAPGQDLQQLWFPGVHSDIGGGYNDSLLWRCAFDWIIAEARAAEMTIDEARLAQIAPPLPNLWKEDQHKSLKGLWWILELFPKISWNFEKKRNGIRFNLGRYRRILEGELIHAAALERIRGTSYGQKNLSKEFIAEVKALASVPPSLPYRGGA
jgi:uncharacterized protein (DUF2235 family)